MLDVRLRRARRSQQAVEAAYNIARFTAEDDSRRPAGRRHAASARRATSTCSTRGRSTPSDAIKLAQACEARRSRSARRSSTPKAPTCAHRRATSCWRTRRGFVGGYPYSRHSISVAPIARDAATACSATTGTRRRASPTSWRRPKPSATMPPACAGAPLGSRQMKTRKCRCCSRRRLPAGCWAISCRPPAAGRCIARRPFWSMRSASRLFADHITLHEDPYLPRGTGRAPFDEEGVRGIQRDVVAGGVLTGYFLSSYSARKLGMRSTGNAGGSYNFEIRSTCDPARRRPRRRCCASSAPACS